MGKNEETHSPLSFLPCDNREEQISVCNKVRSLKHSPAPSPCPLPNQMELDIVDVRDVPCHNCKFKIKTGPADSVGLRTRTAPSLRKNEVFCLSE